MKPHVRWRRLVGLVILLVIVTITLFVIYETTRISRLHQRARSIPIAATYEEVIDILGRPTMKFPRGSGPFDQTPLVVFTGVSPETWAYGSRFDWSNCVTDTFPYVGSPFRWRMFGPDDEDVAVEFDVEGRVSRVTIPQ